jgi:hypothetical protein
VYWGVRAYGVNKNILQASLTDEHLADNSKTSTKSMVTDYEKLTVGKKCHAPH